MSDSGDSRYNEDWFVNEFLTHQRRVYGVILSVVQSRDDAEDLFQTVCLTLWKRRADFDPQRGTFMAWAVGISRNQIRNYLRDERRRRERVVFSEALVEEMAELEAVHAEALDELGPALRACLGALRDQQRKLIQQFYERQKPVSDIAKSHGLGERTLYRRIDQIRELLLGCVHRRLRGGVSS